MTQPDAKRIATQLHTMQQDLQALKEALHQLTDILIEQEKQLSPQAKSDSQHLRT